MLLLGAVGFDCLVGVGLGIARDKDLRRYFDVLQRRVVAVLELAEHALPELRNVPLRHGGR